MKELIKAILAYRAKHNLTTKELARRCNLSTFTLYTIERGERKSISRLTQAKIEMVIGGDKE